MRSPTPPVDKTRIRLTIVLIAAALLASCSVWMPPGAGSRPPVPPSTFERVLSQAEEGDASSHNLVGYMLSTGQGTPRDHEAALRWFASAAEQGYVIAEVNLAILHYLGAGVPRDPAEAERLFRHAVANPDLPLPVRRASLKALVDETCERTPASADVGSESFRTFCSGCHGVNGIAELGSAPSFAFGERMEKETRELLNTVSNGHGSMPRWDDKLPEEFLEGALAYARSLEDEFRSGIVHIGEEPPARYFRFGAMDTGFGAPATLPSAPREESAPPLEELCSGARETEARG